MAGTLSAVTGWLFLTTVVICVGAVTTRWFVLSRLAPDDPERDFALGSVRRFGFLAASVLPIAMAAAFGRQLVEFHDPFVAWREDAELLLLGTAWGSWWTTGMVGAVLAPIGFTLARRFPTAGWLLATGSVLSVVAFSAFTGHASGTGGLRPLTLAADGLHLVAAGGWVGSLAIVLLADRAWHYGQGEGSSLLPLLVPPFSALALTCVSILVLTGLAASWVHVGSIESLFSGAYGRTLLLKLALVLVVGCLGAFNWRRLSPGLSSGSAPALRRSAAYELTVAQLVLLVTAILIQTPPLGH